MKMKKYLAIISFTCFLSACVSQNKATKEELYLRKIQGVKEQVQTIMPQMQECVTTYEAQGEIVPDMVLLDFWIEPSGKVDKAFAHGLDFAPQIRNCLISKLRKKEFSAPEDQGAVWIRNPISFRVGQLKM